MNSNGNNAAERIGVRLENWGQTRFSRNWKYNEQNQMTTAKILPTWDENLNAPPQARWDRGNVASPMPFEPVFWTSPRHVPNGTAKLSRVKGFIASLPVHWTEGENIRFDYPSSLVTQNDHPADHVRTNRAQVYARALADVQG